MSVTELTVTDLQSILSFVTALAREAGKLILEGSAAIQSASSESGVNEKKNSVDLVTEYDVRVEELVQTKLKLQYPSFKLFGFFNLRQHHHHTHFTITVSEKNLTRLDLALL